MLKAESLDLRAGVVAVAVVVAVGLGLGGLALVKINEAEDATAAAKAEASALQARHAECLAGSLAAVSLATQRAEAAEAALAVAITRGEPDRAAARELQLMKPPPVTPGTNPDTAIVESLVDIIESERKDTQ